MSSLAEIVAEGKRQLANYRSVILHHDDAMRLLAVCEAAVEMREAQKERNAIRAEPCSCDEARCDRCQRLASNIERRIRSLAAFDAAAGGQP